MSAPSISEKLWEILSQSKRGLLLFFLSCCIIGGGSLFLRDVSKRREESFTTNIINISEAIKNKQYEKALVLTNYKESLTEQQELLLQLWKLKIHCMKNSLYTELNFKLDYQSQPLQLNKFSLPGEFLILLKAINSFNNKNYQECLSIVQTSRANSLLPHQLISLCRASAATRLGDFSRAKDILRDNLVHNEDYTKVLSTFVSQALLTEK